MAWQLAYDLQVAACRGESAPRAAMAPGPEHTALAAPWRACRAAVPPSLHRGTTRLLPGSWEERHFLKGEILKRPHA
uniref:Uncharacterized protein n=1 Tax=Pelusios castaneus TaxID=367368 RepID=A0A8C8RNG1_9SAUR